MIRRIEWNEAATRGLSRALPALTIGIVESEVRRGLSMLWECRDDKHAALCVTRVDANPTEFVIVAFEGTGLLTFAPYFIEVARERGIPLRAHTTSRFMLRLLRRVGFRLEEYVARAA